MKKFVAFFLVFLCIFSCVATASATVVLSTQKLSVDGRMVACEKYNIDGSNYFKLRDLAYLLNGTETQFHVGWDAEAQTVLLTTGVAYEANGTELDLSGGDKSALAVESTQLLQIDGRTITGLVVYNIGGNNYFKLRDLGIALGFSVGYNSATGTAEIQSGKLDLSTARRKTEVVTETTVQERYRKTVTKSETVYGYDENGRLQSQETTVTNSADGTQARKEIYAFHYDSKGNLTEQIFTLVSGGEETTETVSYNYNSYGDPIKRVYRYSDGKEVSVKLQYDAKNRLQVEWSEDNKGNREIISYTYNGMGDIASKVEENKYGFIDAREYVYTYDGKGSILRKTSVSKYGMVWNSHFTYDSEGNILSVKSDDGNRVTEFYGYTYDKIGKIQTEIWEHSSLGNRKTVHFYDIYGDEALVKEESTDKNGNITQIVTTVRWEETAA